jgi:hypothetical protein
MIQDGRSKSSCISVSKFECATIHEEASLIIWRIRGAMALARIRIFCSMHSCHVIHQVGLSDFSLLGSSEIREPKVGYPAALSKSSNAALDQKNSIAYGSETKAHAKTLSNLLLPVMPFVIFCANNCIGRTGEMQSSLSFLAWETVSFSVSKQILI